MLSLRNAMVYVAVIMAIKSLAGVAALKIQATQLVPSNFAVLSQFMTIAGLVTNISSAAVTSGMTVLLARVETTTSSAGELIRSGQVFSIGLSCLMSLSCVLLFFLDDTTVSISPLPRYLFLILAITPWLVTQSSIAQARLTSSYQLGLFTRLSNGSAIAVALLIIVFTIYFGLLGSALAVAIGPMLTASILLLFATHQLCSIDQPVSNKNRSRDIIELLRFSAAMLVAICAVPLSHILVRESMVDMGLGEQAGYWSATVRLSDVYMQFFGLLLTFYVLPKISASMGVAQVRRIFTSYFARLAIIGAVVLVGVYVLRQQLVRLALADEFSSTVELLPIQLLGDFFRIILSFFFWFSYGQNLRTLAATEEVLQAGLFYLFFKVIFNRSDALGVVEAHFFSSMTNLAISGSCLLYVLARRR